MGLFDKFKKKNNEEYIDDVTYIRDIKHIPSVLGINMMCFWRHKATDGIILLIGQTIWQPPT